MPAVARRPKAQQKQESRRPPGVLLPQHERFARGIAEGLTGGESYSRHVATTWVSRDTANSAASRLLSDGTIRARITELSVDFKEFLKKKGFAKEQLAAYLIEAIETPISEIGPDHRLASKLVLNDEGGLKSIESFSKEKATDALAKLAGFNEPDKVESTVAASPEIRAAMDKLFKRSKD